MNEENNAPARKDISSDFPLRGFVTCNCCDKPLRSCWSQGKTKKHPYYLCQTKKCEMYGKSIRRADIENRFEDLLQNLQPSLTATELLKRMIKDAWTQRVAQSKHWRQAVQKEIQNIDKQIDGFLDRIVESNSPAAITAYERKLTQLEKNKLAASEKLENGLQMKGTIEQVLELSLEFLANPWNIWKTRNIKLQKLVLRLAFSERLAYCKKEGYRTPKMALPFNMLVGFSDTKSVLVAPAGLEPARPKAHDFKSCASTDSATGPKTSVCYRGHMRLLQRKILNFFNNSRMRAHH